MMHMVTRDLTFAYVYRCLQRRKGKKCLDSPSGETARRRKGGHHTMDVRFLAAAVASFTFCCKMSSDIRGTDKPGKCICLSRWSNLENWHSNSILAIKHVEYLGMEVNCWNNIIAFGVTFLSRSVFPSPLGCFEPSNSILQNRTTTSHQALIVAIQCLLLLVERLFQRYHLYRIDEVLKCGDSMINLHMLSQIPSSCLYTQLSVLATAPKILISFFPSHVKILLCTDKIVSTGWQDLVPRQRTGDCFVIHLPH